MQQMLSISANQTYFTQHMEEGSILNQEMFLFLKGHFLVFVIGLPWIRGLTLPWLVKTIE